MVYEIEGLEVKCFDGPGYKEQIDYDGWRVAIANYKPELRKENLTFLERHLDTDEVFILIEGTAGLLLGNEKQECMLEKGRLYNVKCGIWHRIYMSPGTKVVIVENADTGTHNTEYLEINALGNITG